MSESPNQADVPAPEEEALPVVPVPEWERDGEQRGAVPTVPVLRPGDDGKPLPGRPLPGKPGAMWEAAGLRGKLERRRRSVRRAARRVMIGAAACLVLVVVALLLLRNRAADEVPAGYQPGFLPAETRGARSDSGLAKMEKALREQEDRVEEKRKVLNSIVETKGIVYKGGESVFDGSPVGADEDMIARSASMTFEQLEQEKVQLESQVQSLLKYDDEQLVEFAAGLNLPENAVERMRPGYTSAKTQLIELHAAGLGEDHPRVVAQREVIADRKEQLDDGVVALRNTLRAQLDLTKERLAKMEGLKREREEAAVKTGIDTYDFVEARKEFEQAREMFDQMRIKYQGERIQLELPRNPIVIHEEASVVRKPSWYSIDRRSESRAVVQVNPRTPDMRVFGGHYSESSGAGPMTEQFFGTGFGVLKAEKTLEPVVEELRLDRKWGVSKEQALRRLKDSVETENVPGTDLIEIRAKDADPVLSRDIASGVAKAYRDRRAGLEEERAREALDKLNEALREQEDRVDEKRKSLNTIVETKGIVYRGGDSIFGGAPLVGGGGAEGAEELKPPPRERVNDAIDLMAEVSAMDQSFSTFSLHVSDASFRVAGAALGRGERPDPGAVRPEEFYNAFDYGDPAPTAGETVACAIEQCAHPLLPSRNLVRIGVRTAAEGRGEGQALRLTILLDSSGSMEREDRRAAVEVAMGQLVSLLGTRDVITVIGFSRRPRLLVDRMDGDTAQRDLAGVVRQIPAEGGTNLEWALELADDLAIRQFDAGAQNRIVLLTDGAANLGNADPDELAKRVEGLRQRGVSFDAAGFGTAGMNDRMLERLTRDGNGRYYVVDGPEDADEQFARKLAGAFRPAAENVKVQVRFNPLRVVSYRLIGFEEHRLKKEDFRDDSVDAAEMASEEAGVAVYQVTLSPDGEGEIGEVSVRFRDAAKGGMVERSWTVPHDVSAPGFDRASGSMQVAGLAVLAAEALRDGPLAPLIDWGEMAQVSNRVRAEFGGSEKVGHLLRMVERIR